MKTFKMCLGGLCVGDTFHVTPFLNELDSQYDKIIWLTGNFSKQASEFLAQCYPKLEIIYRPDTLRESPLNAEDIEAFSRAYADEFNSIPADEQATGIECCWVVEAQILREGARRFPRLDTFAKPVPSGIIIHPQSRNNWKNVAELFSIDWKKFGVPIYTVGSKNESLIPDSIDLRGISFVELAPYVLAARVVVGIHSAVACFTFYTPTNQVTCHVDDHSYLRFGLYKANAVDIITPAKQDPLKPNATKIAEAVEQFF